MQRAAREVRNAIIETILKSSVRSRLSLTLKKIKIKNKKNTKNAKNAKNAKKMQSFNKCGHPPTIQQRLAYYGRLCI
jgi:hypothetical protein